MPYVASSLSLVSQLPQPVQGLALRLWYIASLGLLALVFLAAVLPVCTFVGFVYGFLVFARIQLLGAPPGRYIEEANLKKGQVSGLQRFLVLNRSPMVLAFVLPLSRAYQIYTSLRSAFTQAIGSAPSLHAQRVAHIQKQFEQWRKEGGKRRIVTARPGWKRVSMKTSTYKKDCFQVHVDGMTDIIQINTEARWVVVEPMVTMGQLVPALMETGWTLPVVPELEELTVGGMVAGTGVESSSHHSGLFQEFCLELEVVLASGSVVTCSRQEREDLFEAFFWSYGTLGMLVGAKLRIIPSAPYVRLCYHSFDSEDAFVSFWRAEANKGLRHAEAGDDVDLDGAGDGERCARFVEGLIFSESRGVVMTGDFAHKVGEDGTLYEHGKWHKPYFYRHAGDMLCQSKPGGAPIVEYWPLRHYYYRHSRSVFWEMENIVPLGDSPLFRWGFGWMLPPSVSFLKVTTPAGLQKFYDAKHVIQDMLVPAAKIREGLEVFRRHFDIYPLWVCPMYLRPGAGLVHARGGEGAQMYVDLGAYGVPGFVKRGEDYDVVEQIRAVEDFVASVDGFEMLYADSYMSRKEFAKMFDRALYDKLRAQLGGDKAFPDIYDKIVEPRRLQQLRERFGPDFVQ